MKPEEFWFEIPEIIRKRGEEIRNKGGILEVIREKDRLKALVKGTYHPYYEVEIRLDGDDFRDWDCNCPYDGGICKHVAAVIKEVFLSGEAEAKKRKKKTKAEMAGEILEKLSEEELREFLKDLVTKEAAVRNTLLARFFHYTDFGARTLEAKYNALFRNLLQTYTRHGLLDYYATMDFGEKILEVISSAKSSLEKGRADEAFVVAKCMLRNWVKNLEKMDDSSGTTSFVLTGVFDLFTRLYRAGKEEIFDFLLREAQEELYQPWGIEYEIAEVLLDLVDSPEKARKLLELLDTFRYGGLYKARLLLKFFPEEYEEFVREAVSDWEVARFHLEKLIKEEAFEEALEYVTLVLSVPEIPRKEDFLKTKALILENLDRKEEAFGIYRRLFEKTRSLESLRRAKKIASEEEWLELKDKAEEILRGAVLLEFLAEEKEYDKFLERLKGGLADISYGLGSWEEAISLIRKLPREPGYAAAEILLEAAPLLLRERTSRQFYRSFLSVSRPLFELLGRKRTEEFLSSLISLFPRRRSLKDEIENYLKT